MQESYLRLIYGIVSIRHAVLEVCCDITPGHMSRLNLAVALELHSRGRFHTSDCARGAAAIKKFSASCDSLQKTVTKNDRYKKIEKLTMATSSRSASSNEVRMTCQAYGKDLIVTVSDALSLKFFRLTDNDLYWYTVL